MKKNICLIVGTVLLIFVWTNTSFAADKIGFVNLREVFQNSTAGKKAGEELKKLADKKQEGIKTMENEVKKMKDELEKQSSVMTASARSPSISLRYFRLAGTDMAEWVASARGARPG